MINRICIVVAFTIYTLAGREIYQNREQLRAFNRRSGYPKEIGNPFDSYKTTEVNITTETIPITGRGLVSTTANKNVPSRTPSGRGYDPYTVTIGSAPPSSRTRRPLTPSGETLTYRKNKAAMEANTAAWGYTKCALLLFVSLLITWVSRYFSYVILCAIVGRSWFRQAPLTLNLRFLHPSTVSTLSSTPTWFPFHSLMPPVLCFPSWDSGTLWFTSPRRGHPARCFSGVSFATSLTNRALHWGADRVVQSSRHPGEARKHRMRLLARAWRVWLAQTQCRV